MRLDPKSGLLAGCALGAALAALPHDAQAQSFQGVPDVVTGQAFVTTDPGGGGVPATTTIDVLTPETVINWTAVDFLGTGNIDFQPAGTTASFKGDDLTDFTVLNRILPVDGNSFPAVSTVTFNGTVESHVISGQTGGQVWFYSPTGIIAGPTAVFNVGSLILTTNDIQFVPNDLSASTLGYIYGPGGLVQFAGPANSVGRVEVQAGAQLNAAGNLTGSSAYVALVAPRVVQSGTVTADGNIAYIAAEQVDMTINAGLVDFTLTAGTTDANGIVHSGTTTGPASTNAADLQRVSLVALPKNDALTMLLSGSIGYIPAANAFNEGSAIVLAAGFDTAAPAMLPDNRLGSIDIGAATFTNDLSGYATDGITVSPPSGTTSFGGNATLQAAQSIEVSAGAAGSVSVDGSLFLTAGAAGTGGAITISGLTGGSIDVTGTIFADASSYGILSAASLPSDGIGGSVQVLADGGTITGADLYVSAGGNGAFDAIAGGDGRGGDVEVSVANGGTISAGYLTIDAYGSGGSSDGSGGDGFGGSILVADGGGSLDFGTVGINARAYGGFGGNGGSATGGIARVVIALQAQDWDYLSIDTGASAGPAEGLGGLSGSVPGGGEASLEISGSGALSVLDGVNLTANSYMNFDGPAGFSGQAGQATISVSNGGSLVTDAIYVEASARFSEEYLSSDPGSSPAQRGGTVSITADGGTIMANGISALAEAYGLPASAVAGTTTGGTATVSALGGGSIEVDDGSNTSVVLVSADSFSGFGPVAGDAIGGTAGLVVEDSSFVVAGDIYVSANGSGAETYDAPLPGDGLDATGGSAAVRLLEGSLGTAQLSANSLLVTATGDARLFVSTGTGAPGGDPIVGNGGNGTGGSAGVSVAAGALTTANLIVDSSGAGGGSGASDGTAAFQSGDGSGGSSGLAISGGTIAVTTLNVFSDGIGGDGTAGPAATGTQLAALAGNGSGGSVSLQLAGGSLEVTNTTLRAIGLGATGMSHAGGGDATDGGQGMGGTVSVSAAGGWNGSYSTATLQLLANGLGGLGGTSPTGTNGNGGIGEGGVAAVELADGAFMFGNVSVTSTGSGGDGELGGEGLGGRAAFAIADSAAGPSGTRQIASLNIDSSAIGGVGENGVTALSGAGRSEFQFDVLGAASAIDLTGSLTVRSSAVNFTPASGIHGQVSGGAFDIGGDLLLSTTGPIVIAANQPLNAAGSATISGASFTSTGIVTSGLSMDVSATSGIDAGELRSGGTTNLTASAGAVAVDNLLSAGEVTALGQSIDIASQGSLSFATAQAGGGDLSIRTGGDLAVNSASASQTIDLASGGTFSLAGGAVGRVVRVTSSDIAIDAAAGFIGELGFTDSITLLNGDPARTTFLGGETQTGGYSLDRIELTRLFAGSLISLGVPLSSSGGLVNVGDFALTFGPGGNIGSGGTLEISTPAEVLITGNAALTTSGADDTFRIDPAFIGIDTSTGSIAMRHGNGAPAGRLELIGDTVAVATTNVLGQLRTPGNLDTITALLGNPGGTAEPLTASTIAVTVTSGFYVQNTGASTEYADRRGFNTGSLEIGTAGTATQIAINGQILTGAGAVTGLDTVPLVTINGQPAAVGGLFHPGSTINGCVIATNCGLAPEPQLAPKPPSDKELAPVSEAEPASSFFVAPLIELAETRPLIEPPLVDEPITGVGNDDLWEPPCGAQGENGNAICRGGSE